MPQAYVLIQTDVGKASVIAEQVRQVPGVLTAEDVVGPYDVVARIESRSGDPLSSVVAGIQQVLGITRTLTCELAVPAT